MNIEMEVITDTQTSQRRRYDRRAKNSIFHLNVKALYGHRRRPRRAMERYYHGRAGYFVDVYRREIGLLSVLLLLLSCADAFMTLQLLQLGAVEINPAMDYLIKGNVQSFVSFKVALTALSILLFVRYSNFHVIGGIKVVNIMRTACVGYALLFAYELLLFNELLSR